MDRTGCPPCDPEPEHWGPVLDNRWHPLGPQDSDFPSLISSVLRKAKALHSFLIVGCICFFQQPVVGLAP